MKQNPKSPLERAIEILGGQQAVASICGVTQQYVSDVCRGARRKGIVPAEWCRPIEEATKAAGEIVRSSELRPDIFSNADAAE